MICNVSRAKERKESKDHNNTLTMMKGQDRLLVLKIIVFLDFLAVGILVPLMPNYFHAKGLTNEKMAFISSAYHGAQVLGGVILGWLSDNHMSRKSILLISLLSSTISYAIVAVARSAVVLLFSRIIVGLLKQTMTVSLGIITDMEVPRAEKTKQIAQMSAIATVSFIVGPSLGGLLYTSHTTWPAISACFVFFVDFLVCLIFFKEEDITPGSSCKNGHHGKKTLSESVLDVRKNIQATFGNKETQKIVTVKLMRSLFARSLTATNFYGYLESRYGFQRHKLGYLSSYRAIISFFTQTFLVGLLVGRSGMSEETMAKFAVWGLMLVNGYEVFCTSQVGYLFLQVPCAIVAGSILDVCIKGIYAHSIPKGLSGQALGASNVLTALIGIVSPIYGGELFEHFGEVNRPKIVVAHYSLLLLFLIFFYPMKNPLQRRTSSSLEEEDENLLEPESPNALSKLSRSVLESDKKKEE